MYFKFQVRFEDSWLLFSNLFHFHMLNGCNYTMTTNPPYIVYMCLSWVPQPPLINQSLAVSFLGADPCNQIVMTDDYWYQVILADASPRLSSPHQWSICHPWAGTLDFQQSPWFHTCCACCDRKIVRANCHIKDPANEDMTIWRTPGPEARNKSKAESYINWATVKKPCWVFRGVCLLFLFYVWDQSTSTHVFWKMIAAGYSSLKCAKQDSNT